MRKWSLHRLVAGLFGLTFLFAPSVLGNDFHCLDVAGRTDLPTFKDVLLNSIQVTDMSRLPADVQKSLKDLGIANGDLYGMKIPGPDFKRRQLPRPVAVDDPGAGVAIEQLHFMQHNASNQTRDGLYTVLSNALQFRSGTLRAADLPPIRVWRDETGKIWTLDHRRLVSMALGNIKGEVPVEWVTSPIDVQKESYKYSTYTGGESIFLRLDRNVAILIGTAGERRIISPRNFQPTNLPPKPLPPLARRIGPDAVERELRVALDELGIPLEMVATVRTDRPDFRKRPVPPLDNRGDFPAKLSIDTIRFMQESCSNTTRDGIYTVIGNARDFRDGRLRVEQLPPIQVWRDIEGRIWTLDHRRLASMALGNVQGDIPVSWVKDFNTVKDQSYKYSTATEGETIFLNLNRKATLVVSTGINGRPRLVEPDFEN